MLVSVQLVFSRGERSSYQVAVTGLQGLVDSLTDLTRSRLPGTESQLAVKLLIIV